LHDNFLAHVEHPGEKDHNGTGLPAKKLLNHQRINLEYFPVNIHQQHP